MSSGCSPKIFLAPIECSRFKKVSRRSELYNPSVAGVRVALVLFDSFFPTLVVCMKDKCPPKLIIELFSLIVYKPGSFAAWNEDALHLLLMLGLFFFWP
jgi:hypothetical protein